MLEISIRLPRASFVLDIEFTTRARVLAVLGPSGSGKTTLLSSIAGLTRPFGGRIYVDGRAFVDGARAIFVPPERRQIGYVPQGGALFPHLSVLDNIRFAGLPVEPSDRSTEAAGAGRRGRREAERRGRREAERRGRREAERARVDELSAILELGPLLARSPATLSGGEKQRVALARALFREPSLLLLDEPLGSMDSASRERIAPYLRRIERETKARIVYVTHDAAEAAFLADEALVLGAGRIRDQGPPSAILGSLPAELGITVENTLRGRIVAVQPNEGTASLLLDPSEGAAASEGAATTRAAPLPRLAVPYAADLREGDAAAFALRAEDVVLAPGPPTRLSARNVVEARVAAIEPRLHHTVVRAHLGGATLAAFFTRGAARELDLAPGAVVYLVFKTSSLRRIA